MDANLQLEALREVKNWNIWLLGFAGTLSTAAGVVSAVAGSNNDEHDVDAKPALAIAAVAIVLTVVTVYNIPAMIDRIGTAKVRDIGDAIVIPHIRLGMITLWSQIAVLASAFFMFSIVWRTAFNVSFMDWFYVLIRLKPKEDLEYYHISYRKLHDLNREVELLKKKRDEVSQESLKRKYTKEILDLEADTWKDDPNHPFWKK